MDTFNKKCAAFVHLGKHQKLKKLNNLSNLDHNTTKIKHWMGIIDRNTLWDRFPQKLLNGPIYGYKCYPTLNTS